MATAQFPNLTRVSRERRTDFASDTFTLKHDGKSIEVTVFSDRAPIWTNCDDQDLRDEILTQIGEQFGI